MKEYIIVKSVLFMVSTMWMLITLVIIAKRTFALTTRKYGLNPSGRTPNRFTIVRNVINTNGR